MCAGAHALVITHSSREKPVTAFEQTVLMVTRDRSAAVLADRVVFLNDGRIVHDNAVAERRGDPRCH